MMYRVTVATYSPSYGAGSGELQGYCTGEANGICHALQRAGALARQLLGRDEVVEGVTIEVPYIKEA